MSDTQVRTYTTRKSMDQGVAEMARRGYRVQGQSGQLAANMWTQSMLTRPKVTVTFVRDDPVEQAPPDIDAAIALLVRNGYSVTPPSA
jgi:hypothetical protein